ncbi:MAG: ArsB/NhaD family transporter [Gemmatimonadaceae bacterium]
MSSGLSSLLQAPTDALAPTTDVTSQVIVALVLIALFALLAKETAHRVLIAMSAVSLLWTITYLTPFHLITFEGAVKALDVNVLMLLGSMMALVGVLKTTGAFETMVSRILVRARGRPLVILSLIAWFTAIASAFLDNVTTVIFVTPMAIAIARRLGMRPAVLLLPMTMASNIGGTATLIGDPPNIMIGSAAHLSFVDFLVDLTVPCVVMVFWLEWLSRRTFHADLAAPVPPGAAESSAVPLINPRLGHWMIAICLGVLVGFLTHHRTGMPPAVPALIGAAVALVVQDVLYVREHRPTLHERIHGVLQITEHDIEWPTLSFFGCLFIVVGAAVQTGLIGHIADGLQWLIAASSGALGLGDAGALGLAALLICWCSGLASALIDNIPFVAVCMPIVSQLTHAMPGETQVLWWALSLGACLGGNGTLIGASANVTTVGLAERAGIRITFRDFMDSVRQWPRHTRHLVRVPGDLHLAWGHGRSLGVPRGGRGDRTLAHHLEVDAPAGAKRVGVPRSVASRVTCHGGSLRRQLRRAPPGGAPGASTWDDEELARQVLLQPNGHHALVRIAPVRALEAHDLAEGLEVPAIPVQRHHDFLLLTGIERGRHLHQQAILADVDGLRARADEVMVGADVLESHFDVLLNARRDGSGRSEVGAHQVPRG